jgi:hypothetical protein
MSVVKANGVEIHVEPGEVVVVNGVSVEVQRAGGGKSRPMPLLISGPKKSQSNHKGKPIDTAANQVILDCLTEHGPLDAGRILDHLGLDTKDNRRKVTGQRIYRMVEKGILRRIKADKHKGQPRYEIAPGVGGR